MKVRVAVLALTLSACSSPAVSGDAAFDVGLDTGTVVDASVSDAPTIDATATDAAVDGGMGYPGECSIVPQSGCASDEACRASRTADGLIAECQPAGELEEGASFDEPGEGCIRSPAGELGDGCDVGLVCDADQCARYCLLGGPSSQCPPVRGFSMHCEQEWEDGFPLGLCRVDG